MTVLDIEQIIELSEQEQVIYFAKRRLDQFKKSGYSTDLTAYKKKVASDIKSIEALGATGYIIPTRPEVIRFMLRQNLDDIGLSRDEILKVLNEVFNENKRKRSGLKKENVEAVDELIKQYQEWRKEKVLKHKERNELEREYRVLKARDDNHHSHFVEMQKSYNDTITKLKRAHEVDMLNARMGEPSVLFEEEIAKIEGYKEDIERSKRRDKFEKALKAKKDK